MIIINYFYKIKINNIIHKRKLRIIKNVNIKDNDKN